MWRPFPLPLCVYRAIRMLCSVVIVRGGGVWGVASVSAKSRVIGGGVVGVVRIGHSVSVLWRDRFTVVCD